MDRRGGGMGPMMPFFGGGGLGEQPPAMPTPDMPSFPHMRERFPNSVWGPENQAQWGAFHPPNLPPPPPPMGPPAHNPHQFNQFEPRQPVFNFAAPGAAPPSGVTTPVSQYSAGFNGQYNGAPEPTPGYVPQGHFSPQAAGTAVPFNSGPPNGFLTHPQGNGVMGSAQSHTHAHPYTPSNEYSHHQPQQQQHHLHQQQQQQPQNHHQQGMFKSPLPSPAVSAPDASPVQTGFAMTSSLPSPHGASSLSSDQSSAAPTVHTSVSCRVPTYSTPGSECTTPLPHASPLSSISTSSATTLTLNQSNGSSASNGTNTVQSRLKNMIMSRQGSNGSQGSAFSPGPGLTESPPLGELRFSGSVAAVTSVASSPDASQVSESFKMAQNFLAYRTTEPDPGSVVQHTSVGDKGDLGDMNNVPNLKEDLLSTTINTYSESKPQQNPFLSECQPQQPPSQDEQCQDQKSVETDMQDSLTKEKNSIHDSTTLNENESKSTYKEPEEALEELFKGAEDNEIENLFKGATDQQTPEMSTQSQQVGARPFHGDHHHQQPQHVDPPDKMNSGTLAQSTFTQNKDGKENDFPSGMLSFPCSRSVPSSAQTSFSHLTSPVITTSITSCSFPSDFKADYSVNSSNLHLPLPGSQDKRYSSGDKSSSLSVYDFPDSPDQQSQNTDARCSGFRLGRVRGLGAPTISTTSSLQRLACVSVPTTTTGVVRSSMGSRTSAEGNTMEEDGLMLSKTEGPSSLPSLLTSPVNFPSHAPSAPAKSPRNDCLSHSPTSKTFPQPYVSSSSQSASHNLQQANIGAPLAQPPPASQPPLSFPHSQPNISPQQGLPPPSHALPQVSSSYLPSSTLSQSSQTVALSSGTSVPCSISNATSQTMMHMSPTVTQSSQQNLLSSCQSMNYLMSSNLNPPPPQSISQPSPQSLTLQSPQSLPHQSPQNAPHPSPQNIPHLSPQTIPHLSPQHITHPSPQNVPHPSPQSMTHLSPQNPPHSSPQNIPQHIHQNILNQSTQSMAVPSQQQVPPQSGQNIPHPSPQNPPLPSPQNLPHPSPQNLTQPSPQGLTHSSQILSHPSPQAVPHPPQNMHHPPSQPLPQPSPQPIAQPSPQSMSHPSSQAMLHSQALPQHPSQNMSLPSMGHGTQNIRHPSPQSLPSHPSQILSHHSPHSMGPNAHSFSSPYHHSYPHMNQSFPPQFHPQHRFHPQMHMMHSSNQSLSPLNSCQHPIKNMGNLSMPPNMMQPCLQPEPLPPKSQPKKAPPKKARKTRMSKKQKMMQEKQQKEELEKLRFQELQHEKQQKEELEKLRYQEIQQQQQQQMQPPQIQSFMNPKVSPQFFGTQTQIGSVPSGHSNPQHDFLSQQWSQGFPMGQFHPQARQHGGQQTIVPQLPSPLPQTSKSTMKGQEPKPTSGSKKKSSKASTAANNPNPSPIPVESPGCKETGFQLQDSSRSSMVAFSPEINHNPSGLYAQQPFMQSPQINRHMMPSHNVHGNLNQSPFKESPKPLDMFGQSFHSPEYRPGKQASGNNVISNSMNMLEPHQVKPPNATAVNEGDSHSLMGQSNINLQMPNSQQTPNSGQMIHSNHFSSSASDPDCSRPVQSQVNALEKETGPKFLKPPISETPSITQKNCHSQTTPQVSSVVTPFQPSCVSLDPTSVFPFQSNQGKDPGSQFQDSNRSLNQTTDETLKVNDLTPFPSIDFLAPKQEGNAQSSAEDGMHKTNQNELSIGLAKETDPFSVIQNQVLNSDQPRPFGNSCLSSGELQTEEPQRFQYQSQSVSNQEPQPNPEHRQPPPSFSNPLQQPSHLSTSPPLNPVTTANATVPTITSFCTVAPSRSISNLSTIDPTPLVPVTEVTPLVPPPISVPLAGGTQGAPADITANKEVKTEVLSHDLEKEERKQRMRVNEMLVPRCSCIIPPGTQDPGPLYTHLGYGSSLGDIRKKVEDRTGHVGIEVRIEKVIFTGKEGKTVSGCPLAKWIIRRASSEEKVLVVAKLRPHHTCNFAWIVVVMVAWEGMTREIADDLYTTLVYKLNKFGNPTERRCATNEDRTCFCQGVDQERCGSSFSFGCSWSMYYNMCKFARSKNTRKFKLTDEKEEQEVEEKLQLLATEISPVYERYVPEAYYNQVALEEESLECRLGNVPGRPWTGVTACLDFCAHSHKDNHNMNNGCTVVATLTKYRDFNKHDDEQYHVLPMYVLDPTDEQGSYEGFHQKVSAGTIEVLTKYPCEVKLRSEPLLSCRARNLLARGLPVPSRGKPGVKGKGKTKVPASLSGIRRKSSEGSHPSVAKKKRSEVQEVSDKLGLDVDLSAVKGEIDDGCEDLGKYSLDSGLDSDDYAWLLDLGGTESSDLDRKKTAGRGVAMGKERGVTGQEVSSPGPNVDGNSILLQSFPLPPGVPNGTSTLVSDAVSSQSFSMPPPPSPAPKRPPSPIGSTSPFSHSQGQQPTSSPSPTLSPLSSPFLASCAPTIVAQHSPHNSRSPLESLNASSPSNFSSVSHFSPFSPTMPNLSPHGMQTSPPLSPTKNLQNTSVTTTTNAVAVAAVAAAAAAASITATSVAAPLNATQSSVPPPTSTPSGSAFSAPHNSPEMPRLSPHIILGSAQHGGFSKTCDKPISGLALPTPMPGTISGVELGALSDGGFEKVTSSTETMDSAIASHSLTNSSKILEGDPDPSGEGVRSGSIEGDTEGGSEDKPFTYVTFSDNLETFRSPDVGGVAIALPHRSILFEYAKHELHATTALRHPDRTSPARISLIFYHHKSLVYRHHGWNELEVKMEKKRLEGERLAKEGKTKPPPKKKKKATSKTPVPPPVPLVPPPTTFEGKDVPKADVSKVPPNGIKRIKFDAKGGEGPDPSLAIGTGADPKKGSNSLGNKGVPIFPPCNPPSLPHHSDLLSPPISYGSYPRSLPSFVDASRPFSPSQRLAGGPGLAPAAFSMPSKSPHLITSQSPTPEHAYPSTHMNPLSAGPITPFNTPLQDFSPYSTPASSPYHNHFPPYMDVQGSPGFSYQSGNFFSKGPPAPPPPLNYNATTYVPQPFYGLTPPYSPGPQQPQQVGHHHLQSQLSGPFSHGGLPSNMAYEDSLGRGPSSQPSSTWAQMRHVPSFHVHGPYAPWPGS